jgi:hypothetical protein
MTTSPLFEFHLTFDDIDDADALMRHLETSLPGRPVQVDIRGGDTRTVSVTITPPPGPERHPFRLAHPDFETGTWPDPPAGYSPVGLTDPGFDPVEPRTCRKCGCTDAAACPGGCSWVDDDLCSACGASIGGTGVEFDPAARSTDAAFRESMRDLLIDAPPTPAAPAAAGEISEQDLADIAELEGVTVDEARQVVTGSPEPQETTNDLDVICSMPIAALDTTGWSPVDLLELLAFKLARVVPSFPAPQYADDVTFADAWSQAWQQFEGMPTKRIIVAALDQLTEPDSYDLAAVAPLVDELVPRFDIAIANRPELADDDHDGHTIDLGPVDAAPAADSGEQDHDPDDEPGPQDAGGAGGAGIREDPEGTNGALATSPAPPATWNPSPGALTDQVVELLEAHPDVVFRPITATELLGSSMKLVATAMSTLASKGRIRKLGRCQYQALDAAQDAPADLRDQLVAWLTAHDTGSARRIADELGTTESVVKLELARMTEAGITRIGGRGWILCTADDAAERHKARRRAAVEAM